MDETRIELESRLAFQEEGIQALNLAVARQQTEIERLRAALAELQAQVRALEPSPLGNPTGGPEIPPHY
ncbi:MAG TPA: SlyX family protein [Sedimenticola sp.]|nr:SlyX family protein [Sedimenticola sp.]